MRNAQARNAEVLITIWGTPKWANGGKTPNFLPTSMSTFQNFTKALASRYSGRYAGYPFVRFYGIWNESNLGLFLSPQFNSAGKIVSPAAYAKLAAAGIAGLKAGNSKALVAIGETSSNGRNKPKAGATDSVRPGTFAEGVAKANKKLKFDAWAHHPYPVPVNQKPTQKVMWPNVALSSLPQFETSIDKWFGRKNIPVWITEYGNETKPGEPAGVTESQQASYLTQAIDDREEGPAGADVRVVRDARLDGQPVAERRLPEDGRLEAARPRFAAAAGPLSPVNGKVTVKGGTKNPAVTVYLRSFCVNSPIGAPVGLTSRATLGGSSSPCSQSQQNLAIDCTVAYRVAGLTVAKGKTYTVAVDANTKNGERPRARSRSSAPDQADRRAPGSRPAPGCIGQPSCSTRTVQLTLPVRVHVEPVRAGAAERGDLVRPDRVDGDVPRARSLPGDGCRPGAEDEVPRPDLDDDAPVALRRRHLDVLGVERAVAALRPRRVPFGRAGDRERHGRAEDGARCRRPATAGAPFPAANDVEPSSTTSASKLPSRRPTASSTAIPRTSGTVAFGGPLETTRPTGPGRRASSPARLVARDHAALGNLPRLLRADAAVKPTRRSAATASFASRPRPPGTAANAVPRLTRRTTPRSLRSTRAPGAGVWATTRPAGTDSEYAREPTVTGAWAASR